MSRIVVLGGAESGYGSAILAKVKGFDVFLSDSSKLSDKYRTELEKWEIAFEEGGHTEELILSADEVIKSPGIPDKAPIIKKLREKGINVISEIEFAGRYCKGKTICITGSNGKTTTTTLLHKILCDAEYDVVLGGNIGESFAYSVATADHDWYVLELSSFQLDGMTDFRADIAILMNITPDHLDRYDYVMQNYIDSKFRVIQNQGVSDAFIYCADDHIISENLPKYDLQMKQLPFSKNNCAGGEITLGGIGGVSIPMESMQIRGIHNCYNVMAASLAALEAGVDAKTIQSSVESFAGVEHRLERAGMIDGVEYINDSKATNVDSVWYALESMTRPVVWIAGGTDKGNDYEPLRSFAADKVKALICLGVDNEKLITFFKGVVPEVVDTHSLDEAMRAAKGVAEQGDVVLLSPACASFDLFRNYEDRGEQFKKWVKDNGGN